MMQNNANAMQKNMQTMQMGFNFDAKRYIDNINATK